MATESATTEAASDVMTLEAEIDWAEVERCDRSYYLHTFDAQETYQFRGVVKADGNYLYLSDGSRLLDFMSQMISDSNGHRHPRIHAEITRAMERYGHFYAGFTSDYRSRACKLIIEDILGSGWAQRVRFLPSGNECCQLAEMMARLYTGKPLILTQTHAFHGWGAGSTQLTGYRALVIPPERSGPDNEPYGSVAGLGVPTFPNPGYVYLPAPEFQDWQGEGTLPSLAAAEEIIKSVGPENIAAVTTETMFGAGSYMPHDDYLPGIRALSQKYDFLWIDDEVITGFGRLGEWFGYQYYEGIKPDLMVVAKGINSCALPIGGVIMNREIGDYFERARWMIGASHEAHPLSCASVVGNLEAMIEEDSISRVRERGTYVREKLDDLKDRHASFGRYTGRGLMYSVDLVNAEGDPIVPEDRFTRFVGDTSRHPNNIVGAECFKRGLYMGGFVPNTIKVAPPFTIEEDEIDFAMATLDSALDVVDELYAN